MPELQPDVIFFDIHLPELSGIDAVELAQEACPGIDIVFVTAYNEYAIQAFELNAVRLLELYEGDYFQEHSYGWAENERERLRKLWCQHARLFARFYEKAGMLNEAIAMYERI